MATIPHQQAVLKLVISLPLQLVCFTCFRINDSA
jgi:hypothetical protein